MAMDETAKTTDAEVLALIELIKRRAKAEADLKALITSLPLTLRESGAHHVADRLEALIDAQQCAATEFEAFTKKNPGATTGTLLALEIVRGAL